MGNEAKTKMTAVFCAVAVKTHNSNILRKKGGNAKFVRQRTCSKRGFSQYTLQFQNVAFLNAICIEAHGK